MLAGSGVDVNYEVPVWYENPSGMIIRSAPPTFVARSECPITCLRLSGGKIVTYVEAGLMKI